MKKVKYIPIGGSMYKRLTVNEVYEVVSYVHGSNPLSINVTIINDLGFAEAFFVYNRVFNRVHDFESLPQFSDVTVECRNNTIDGILL